MTDRDLKLLKGTLGVSITRALPYGSAHGYAVARWVEEVTGQILRIEERSLYPAPERRGWLEMCWGVSASNRPAKFREWTEEGRWVRRVETSARSWFAKAVGMVLGSSTVPRWRRDR